jgi:hypothetical protein
MCFHNEFIFLAGFLVKTGRFFAFCKTRLELVIDFFPFKQDIYCSVCKTLIETGLVIKLGNTCYSRSNLAGRNKREPNL